MGLLLILTVSAKNKAAGDHQMGILLILIVLAKKMNRKNF
jgi:hypothetical protein